MSRKRPMVVTVSIAMIALSFIAARHLWVWRHFYPVRADIDAAVVEAQPLIAELESARAVTGMYPRSLPRPEGPSTTTAAGLREWRYVPAAYGDDYELFCTHNHWFSSFNALVFSPDGQYQPDWLSGRHRSRKGWLYVIGASDLAKRQLGPWREGTP